MAHTKSSGASKYGRDANPKYLGVKKYAGEKVGIGDIIIKQRGTKFIGGVGTKRAGDDSIYAMREGVVKVSTKQKIRFDGSTRSAKVISVVTAL